MASSGAPHDPAVHYDRVTEAWGLLLGDELHYGVFPTGSEALPEATANLTRMMLEGVSPTAGERLLDVGCGTGAPACLLAEHGLVVTGISTSAVGVAAARERAMAAGLTTASFEVRDGIRNEFPDASFDIVWALESSHLMRPRQQMIAECARVLRPGGRLALCDVVLRRPLPFAAVRRLRQPLGVLREVFGDAHMEPLSSYANWARVEGLTVTREQDLTELTRPTFERWRANAEGHRAEVESLIGPEAFHQFVEATEILTGFWDDGTLGYALFVARR